MELPLIEGFEIEEVDAVLSDLHHERARLQQELADLDARLAAARDADAIGRRSLGDRVLQAAELSTATEAETTQAVAGILAAADAEAELRRAQARAEVARRKFLATVASIGDRADVRVDGGADPRHRLIDLARHRPPEAV